MITYSINWMGPINKKWVEEHGDCWSAGRIDIHGLSDELWGLEYSVAPMHTEDWNALGDFLWRFESEEIIPYYDLIKLFEEKYGKKIRWESDRA